MRTPNFTIFVLLFLAALYLALSGSLAPINIAFSALVAALVFVLIRPAVKGDINLARLPRAVAGMLQYIVFLAVDVLRSGIRVARIVLDPRLPIKPGIVAIKSHTRSELGTALSAHAITITPGEMVLEIGDDGTMYTHCLDAEASGAGADAAQATRKAMLEKILA